MWETIQTQVQQGVATLSFNRPDSLNSFNRQMHENVPDSSVVCRCRHKVRWPNTIIP
jgi:enoyl-CoA hydratase/carnithine racemase